MLRATTACTFSTSQLPKVVRSSSVLSILTWKCASRHNGVQLFISHLASWLRTRRFSEPTFRPSGAANHWKNTVFRDFPTFSCICIFFLLIFSLLTLLTSAFQLSILSEVSLLNFLRLSPKNAQHNNTQPGLRFYLQIFHGFGDGVGLDPVAIVPNTAMPPSSGAGPMVLQVNAIASATCRLSNSIFSRFVQLILL